jgi:hypothetical protein
MYCTYKKYVCLQKHLAIFVYFTQNIKKRCFDAHFHDVTSKVRLLCQPAAPHPLPLGFIVVLNPLKATKLLTYSGLRSGAVLVRIQISLWYTGHTECRGWSDSQMVLLSSSFSVN